MDLAPHVAELREQLALAAEAGGDDARAMAERLSASLEAAARLALLEALSAAAAEITQELAPGSVEVRLRGRDPEFVVAAPTSAVSTAPDDEGPAYPVGDDAAMTRVNVRLPQELKGRVEEAARAAGVSVNTWLVRSAAAALSRGPATSGPAPSSARSRDRYAGWVR